jgi:lysylphosphatidylglycerol synthetase-like protein (DUF2156 family)
VPCLYAAAEPVRQICAAAVWGSVQIAQEAVLDLKTLKFTGRRFQDVRSTLNAAHRDGVRTEWIDYRAAPRLIRHQIQAISEDWVAEQELSEMGFTLGGLQQLDDPDVCCSVVLDSAGQVQAVASWLPPHQGGWLAGWSLDFHAPPAVRVQAHQGAAHRRRCPRPAGAGVSAPQPVRYPLTRRAADLGTTAGSDDALVSSADPSLRPLERTLDLLATSLEPVYGFGPLLRFKAKFQPRFHPLYLLYPDPAALPRIARAVTSAYLPDAQLRATLTVLRRAVASRHARRRSVPSA